jgi:hypothetical protein
MNRNLNLDLVVSSIVPIMKSMSEDQKQDYWQNVEKHYNLSSDELIIVKGKVLEIFLRLNCNTEASVPQQLFSNQYPVQNPVLVQVVQTTPEKT